MINVSVIIPTYNSARFLPEAIESVFAQTYKDYEIIVVDDGSTDNTREILKPYFDKIKYIYQQNKGVGSARNTGIRHSQGEYIAFLDADDIWLPEKLHVQVDCLDNNPEIAMVCSRALLINEDGRLIGERSKDRDLPSGNVFNILFVQNFITTSTVMVRKIVFNTIELFDESFMTSGDKDLWFRIAREFKVSGVRKLLCKYRLTSDSLTRKNSIETICKSQRRVIEQHYKLSQDSDRPIASALYKKALAHLFLWVGKAYLAQGDRKKALEKFFQSLKYSPFNNKALKYSRRVIISFFITYIKKGLGDFSMLRYQKKK